MTALSRLHLQKAIAYIADQRLRFGEATVLTTLEVLEERLAALPEEIAGREAMPAPSEQRKQATILFAAIDGFTRLTGLTRNTARLRQIDLLWQRLDETILNYGGIVDKHMGDVIMGIFGAPVAREDDPERAVRCAMALRELVSEFLTEQDPPVTEGAPPLLSNSAMRIGINTGHVSLGPVGSDFGQTVIGDAVNVASRLREAAGESGIYISQDTYRLIRNLFRFESLGEVSIKGRQTPSWVYRVVGALPRLFFPTSEGVEGVHVPMVGREVEIDVLRQMLQRTVQDGQGGLITILGDAGVGKSRLIREFHGHLSDYPFKPTVFQARTDQRLSGVPFSLLRDMLIRHFGIGEGDGAGLIREKIVKGLSASLPQYPTSDLAERARAIGLLMGLEAGAVKPKILDGTDGVMSREQALEGILEYLDAVVCRSAVTLVFLEDIHWADEDSLALLEKLAAIAADRPLLMLCLARPMLLERRPGWPGEQPAGAAHLSLRPLDERDSLDLVRSILRKLPHVPPSLSDLIIRSAAGNPYYVEELVRVLIEDGVIVAEQNAWHLRSRELTRLRVPGTLTGVLQARLDRLPEVERVTLQQAAVIGDEFWVGAVQLVNRAARFPFSEEQVNMALASLERRDMIVRASAPTFTGSRAYLFRHTVLREVAYESILLRDRPGYHLQAVRWLESQMGDRVAEYAAPIAQHYEQAGRPADAGRMYEQAADRAAERFRLLVAIGYYRKVLDLLKNRPQYLELRLGVMVRLGQILQQRGRLVEALDVYQMMHDGAELDGNILGQARARNAQAAIYIELDDPRAAMTASAEAEQLARLTGADLELRRAQLTQSEAAGRLGDRAAATRIATQVLEHLDASRGAPRALALLVIFAAESDAAEHALGQLSALAEEWARHGRADEAAYACEQLGEALLSRRRGREALECFERALAWQRSVGNTKATAELLRWCGLAACRLNDAAVALKFLEEAEALAESTSDRYLRLTCRLVVGEALLVGEQYAAAEATLRQVIAATEDRRRLGSWVNRRRAYELLAAVLTRQGRTDEALSLAGRV